MPCVYFHWNNANKEVWYVLVWRENDDGGSEVCKELMNYDKGEEKESEWEWW